jgi:hypothetical protein
MMGVDFYFKLVKKELKNQWKVLGRLEPSKKYILLHNTILKNNLNLYNVQQE